MNPDGGQQVNLTRHPAADSQPAWAPTGEQILFVSRRNGISDLYLMDADGTNVRKVFKDSILRISPAWSPDAKQISYCSGNLDARKLYIATLGKEIETPVAEVGNFSGYSSWSPDGTKIVFDAPLRRENTATRIHIFNLQTRQQKGLLLKVIPASMGAPAWAPSNEKIAFSWLRPPVGGHSAIYIMNSDGSMPEPVFQPPPEVAVDFPRWAPDGEKLIYEQYGINTQRQLLTINANGGNPKQITDKGINFLADWFDPAFALPVTLQPELLTTTWGEMKQK